MENFLRLIGTLIGGPAWSSLAKELVLVSFNALCAFVPCQAHSYATFTLALVLVYFISTISLVIYHG